MEFHIGVIGGPKKLTEEELDKQVIKQICTFCLINNREKFNVDKFTREIQQMIGGAEADLHDILTYFNDLKQQDKEHIINKCSESVDKVNKADNSTLFFNLNESKEYTREHLLGDKYLRQDTFNQFVNKKMQK